MTWSDSGRNQRAAATVGLVDEVSMHNGTPGVDGTTNEWAGGGYARQSPVFGAGATGVQTATLEFTGPANEDATHIGFWDIGGGFLGGFARTGGDSQANASGEYNAEVPVTSNA